MRKVLQIVYGATAALAGLSLVAIAAIIVIQVVARFAGTQFRGADDFAGFALAATSFLALGPTYRHAEHIRVGLLIERFTGRVRLVIEMVALAIATTGTGWATWWIGRFVYDSWRFNELSQGLVPVPLWIPQSAMLLGLLVFLIALIEDMVRVMAGSEPSYLTARQTSDAPTFER